jgi:NADH-quinone oxidoreductase subunit F
MTKYVIGAHCNGCTKCVKVCPVDAIPYTPYEKHEIDVEKCVKCGLCVNECKFEAIQIFFVSLPKNENGQEGY